MQHCQHHQQCQQEAITVAEKYCATHNLRFTPLRRRVLELIWTSHEPVKAYDILDAISDTDTSSKPPTVYRTLDFLQQYGLVHKLNSQNAYIGCAHPNKHQQCYFLICTACSEVSECCYQSIDTLIQKVAKKNNFTQQHTVLEIQGLCESCQNEKA
jgi:Fur family zinc uptake transcriptional regulator